MFEVNFLWYLKYSVAENFTVEGGDVPLATL